MARDPRREPDADDDAEDTPQPVHERWWWTGTFRGVLGGVVVGFQWPALTSGEAGAANWVVAALGAAVLAWGAWIVWTDWRALQRGPSA